MGSEEIAAPYKLANILDAGWQQWVSNNYKFIGPWENSNFCQQKSHVGYFFPTKIAFRQIDFNPMLDELLEQ